MTAAESNDGAVDNLITRLEACPTATLCDAYIKSGLRRPETLVMHGVRPILRDGRVVAGRARTKQLVIVRDPERSSLVSNRELAFEHIDKAQPGDFLVVAAPRAQPYAIWGGHLTLQASMRGAVGVVVDGTTRDVGEIQHLAFPVWCRGVTPIPSGYAGYSSVGTNVPVTCAGVEVIAGDYVVADQDGVIVVPQEQVLAVLDVCEEMEAAEHEARLNIEAGKTMLESYVSRSYYANRGTDGRS